MKNRNMSLVRKIVLSILASLPLGSISFAAQSALKLDPTSQETIQSSEDNRLARDASSGTESGRGGRDGKEKRSMDQK